MTRGSLQAMRRAVNGHDACRAVYCAHVAVTMLCHHLHISAAGADAASDAAVVGDVQDMFAPLVQTVCWWTLRTRSR